MRFFKRFLSLGSRKSKKKQKAAPSTAKLVDSEGRLVQHDDRDQQSDAEANRLLRSASARFAVVSELDYANLPPLPHPINRVTTATTPPLTPTRSASSLHLQRSGTYVVKVHERQLLSRTEFPKANPPVSSRDDPRTPPHDRGNAHDHPQRRLKEVLFTPRDQSRLLTLRRDPSVASLLNMYDEQGCLDEHAFSNSPPTPAPIHEGHEQRKRTGSTLRQLLGNPNADFPEGNTATEGDISWAERFLEERFDAASPRSSTSSLALETPKDALFSNDHSERHLSLFSALEHELSSNYPVISSMEVELSGGSEMQDSRFDNAISISNALDPKTPQRAAEVFGFLTERRKSLRERASSIPTFSTTALTLTPSDSGTRMSLTPDGDTATSSPASFDDAHSHVSHAQIRTATLTKLSTAPAILNPFSASMPFLPNTHASPRESSKPDTALNYRSVEEPCDWKSHKASTSTVDVPIIPTSRIPRGPRPVAKHDFPYSCTDTARPVPATRRLSRSTGWAPAPVHEPSRHSKRSSYFPPADIDDATKPRPPVRSRSWRAEDKENSATAPSTPVRSRSVFDSRYLRHLHQHDGPPSPASSSELSPIAQEMMSNLRAERLRAREREAGRRGAHGVRTRA